MTSAVAAGHPEGGAYRSPAALAGLDADQLLLERLAAWRRLGPARAFFHRVDATAGGDLRAESFTTSAILDGARACAARLAQDGIGAGDRVLLCLPNSESFVEWFLGAHWLGAIPVPLPSLAAFGGKASLVERVRGVLASCAPRAVVADAGTCRSLEELVASSAQPARRAGEAGPEWKAPVLLDAAVARREGDAAAGGFDRPPHRASPGDVAFIQYTSGSTGEPRGVIITHANLCANLRAIGRRSRSTAGDRQLVWLPLYHDMGLVGGLLFPLYDGHTSYLMSPVAFLARPVNWIRAMSRFRATTTVAPNFAYALCARKLRDADLDGIDLSAWRLAYNGAEPIDPSVLASFAERFRPRGFAPDAMYPVYGLAEATLAVAFPEPGEPLHIDHVDRAALARGIAAPAAAGAGALALVSVGTAVPEHALAIRDPETGAALPERRTGEIVVRGPSVSPGYFGLPPTGAAAAGLATGDLGYIADGRLYVVDRIKDLIIVGGRNLAPSDLERSVAGAGGGGIRAGRAVAFGVADAAGGTEEVVVVAESHLRDGRRLEALRAGVAAAIGRDHGVGVREVVLVEPGSLPRTSSGKVMRRRTRELYLGGGLQAAGTASRVGRWWKRLRMLVAARRMLASG